jgi:3-deoxy-D-manno-octulosonate 8-phosphate phosphatase (KDO 8-P phosphatase)
MKENFKILLKNIRCFIFDVDGVFTNGTLIVMPGELYRIMNIRDGFACKAAIDAGYEIAIISGGKSESVRTRLSNLGIKNIFLGIEDKVGKMNEIMQMNNLKKEEILYMGDDLPDYHVMKLAGVPCCPYDAVHEIKELSLYVSPVKGGEGCVRDVIEQVMRLQGKWFIEHPTSINE